MQHPFSVIKRYTPSCAVSYDHVYLTCPVCDHGMLGKAHGAKPQNVPLSGGRTAIRTDVTCCVPECASNNVADSDEGSRSISVIVYDGINTVVEVATVGER